MEIKNSRGGDKIQIVVAMLCSVFAMIINYMISFFLTPYITNGEFYIPSGYDNILRNTYGDYMTLPPIEQQKPHHIQDVWWN